jgi:hypothetical protein
LILGKFRLWHLQGEKEDWSSGAVGEWVGAMSVVSDGWLV